jgi:hypothetical protein
MKQNIKIFIFSMILFPTIFLAIYAYDNDFLQDKDGDGVYDKLEIAAGLDPDFDECQPKKCKGLTINGITGEEYLIIILDQSLSMEENFKDNLDRMNASKIIIKDYINRSPNFLKLGMYTYGKNDCSALDEVRSPFSNYSKDELINDLEEIKPRGSTPIAATLNKLAEELKDKKGRFNILLVTDGVESCDGDPIAAAKNLISINTLDTGIKLFIAGLQIPKAQAKELEKIAIASQGSYYPINALDEVKDLFEPPLQEIIKNLKGLVCLQIELDDLIRCENNRINKINLVYNKKLINPRNKEFTPDEKDFLRNEIPKLELKSKERLLYFNEVRNLGSDKYKQRIRDLQKLIKPGYN